MGAKRGATRLCGVLPLDKPAGMTSHDVVSAVRRATGEGRVGHAGTLDPAATGLLVVLVGVYTRLEPYLSGSDKTYEARITFGTETDTDDAEGEVTREADVPPELFEPATARRILDGLLGESMQRPPAYSAIKVGGKVAHRVARAGGTLEVAARPIVVREARLDSADAAASAWDVTFRVSKGTYVRALARDVGETAGTAAHLSALRRTASGALDLSAAHTLENVREAAAGGVLPSLFADSLAALALPVVPGGLADVAQGRRLPLSPSHAGEPGALVAVADGARLLAVYRTECDGLVPEAVFAQACP